MSQQTHLTAEVVSSVPAPGRSYTLARLFSQVFHPMITITLSFLMVGIFGSEPWTHGLAWALMSILVQVVPTMVFYTIRLHQGVYSDHEVSVRHQRNELYFFTSVILSLCIAGFSLLHAPTALLALLVSGIFLNLSSWMINLWWKISVHSATAALSALIGMIYVPIIGMLLSFGVLCVGWSRIRTRNHTRLQVVAGICLASAIVGLVFKAFGQY